MYLLLKIHGHSKNESTSVIRLDKHSTLRTTWYWVRVGIGYKLTWVRVGKVRVVLGTS